MELAVVVGHCTATVKDNSLEGRKLALVRAADDSGTPVGSMEVALDVTGAGVGQLVLLTRGSSARQPAENRQLPTDLSIVAIVDELTVPPEPTRRQTASTSGARRPARQPRTPR